MDSKRMVGPLLAALFVMELAALCQQQNNNKDAATLDRWVAPGGSDHANGSRQHPWSSLIRASEMATPGTTVHVLPGIYSGPIISKKSGTQAAPIRFVAEVKWRARIIDSMMADAVWQNDGDYIYISGFDISGVPCVGLLNNGSHVEIANNHVHNLAGGNCGESGGAGIDNGNSHSSDGTIISNVIDHVGDPGQPNSAIHGIYQSNLGGRIAGNVAVCNAGWGIHLWHAATQGKIDRNIVARNGYGGIVIGSGDEPGDAENDNTLVSNNVVWQNQRGIMEFGQTGPHNRFVNNWIYGNKDDQIHLLKGSATGTITRDPQHASDAPCHIPDWLSANCEAMVPQPLN